MYPIRVSGAILACVLLASCANSTRNTPPPGTVAFNKTKATAESARVFEQKRIRGGQSLRSAAQKTVEKGTIKTARKAVPLIAPKIQPTKKKYQPISKAGPERAVSRGGLRGRTMYVSSQAGLKLRNREVVLTFDDGPSARNTPRILAALGKYGVKATFFMSGSMAKANPGLARRVASSGHTIAHHTWSHANLRKKSIAGAMADIRRGKRAIASAVGAGKLSRFFRFPYLADSAALRSSVRGDGGIVVGANVDSKDYFKSSPAAVRARTMKRLRKRGRGIILLHDIHSRTAAMLPGLLADLKREGYKVVTMRSTRGRGPDLVASVLTSNSLVDGSIQ